MSPRDHVPTAAVERLIERWFPGEGRRVERIVEGVSTPIFRVWHGDEATYLRLAEEAGEDRAAEARIHTILDRQGIPLPYVLRFESNASEVGRSAMLTSEVQGLPLDEVRDQSAAATVAVAAGRALSHITPIPVQGYGWVVGLDREPSLLAEHPSRRDWTEPAIAAAYAVTENHLILPAFERRLERTVEDWAARPTKTSAYLAHGDFDTSHIYAGTEGNAGRLTGIIDFGEARGADVLYDLGHFLLHDTDRPHFPLFPALMSGYREVLNLRPAAHREVRIQAVAIGVQRLAVAHQRRAEEYAHLLTERIQQMLLDLDQEDAALVEADSID